MHEQIIYGRPPRDIVVHQNDFVCRHSYSPRNPRPFQAGKSACRRARSLLKFRDDIRLKTVLVAHAD